ncbi:DUF2199 domain-containing protein [Piscinibacter defluvii]|uniref:DUF2199 domain-containing protein n=1 Tax=Piscinibacter defluvii TaxID=1796922 RepID=UPI000FDEA84B|nr:DUF2199 domain-containing protein [Piscinibacter defluvii]
MPLCAECGYEHPLDELELTFVRPDEVAALSTEEREARIQENKDLCVLDGKRFFIRALLPLPIAERERPYNVGIWVEVSQQTFERVYELWDDEEQAEEPAFNAEVANDIPIHPPSLGLSASLSLTGPTTRPVVSLSPAEHPLVGEQLRGITAHRAAQYSSLIPQSAA